MNKSASCFGKTSGTPLAEYHSLEEAQAGASYASDKYGRSLVPYHCRTCSFWHLSPLERHTQTVDAGASCGCVASDGVTKKDAYATDRDAQRRADILRQEKGAELKVYRCTEGWWHLTHHVFQSTSGCFSATKSSSCRGTQGQMLTEYETLQDAVEGAAYTLERHGARMEPWECSDCGRWHLSPSNADDGPKNLDPRVLSSKKSETCRGTHGQMLTEYQTRTDAEEGAKYAQKRFGNRMTPWECSDCGRWHLSPWKAEGGQSKRPTKSATCRGTQGQMLTEYQTRADADEGAEYAQKRFGNRMTPWECSDCGRWHLSPWKAEGGQSKRPTKSETCRGTQGQMLTEYETRADAEDGAEYVQERYGNRMTPVECSNCGKWHLSRAKNTY